MKSISGAQAIALMRQMRHDPALHFSMHHLTYNSDRDETAGMRVIKRCRLRPALPDDAVKTDPDLYLPYTDLVTNEPRMCFKRLIRNVGFPPDFELMKVDWFINSE